MSPMPALSTRDEDIIEKAWGLPSQSALIIEAALDRVTQVMVAPAVVLDWEEALSRAFAREKVA